MEERGSSFYDLPWGKGIPVSLAYLEGEKGGEGREEGQNYLASNPFPSVLFFFILFSFFFYYSYVHTRLGLFLPPAPTPPFLQF
jgi:hypothetical protein